MCLCHQRLASRSETFGNQKRIWLWWYTKLPEQPEQSQGSSLFLHEFMYILLPGPNHSGGGWTQQNMLNATCMLKTTACHPTPSHLARGHGTSLLISKRALRGTCAARGRRCARRWDAGRDLKPKKWVWEDGGGTWSISCGVLMNTPYYFY